jgi:hypothetical protein
MDLPKIKTMHKIISKINNIKPKLEIGFKFICKSKSKISYRIFVILQKHKLKRDDEIKFQNHRQNSSKQKCKIRSQSKFTDILYNFNFDEW